MTDDTVLRALAAAAAETKGDPEALTERVALLLANERPALRAALQPIVDVLVENARAEQTKTQFVALASHELRNPASVIYGIAATLKARGHELRDDQLDALRDTLSDQSDRLRTLVTQLLDLSRLEAKAVRIEPERFAVRDRVQELVWLTAGDRAADVDVDVDEALETVADPEAFDRILSNLLSNALRYGDAPIRVQAQQNDRHFRLVVQDAGQGVAPDFVPQLFESFTRANPEPGSSGLGLAIAKSYAHAHGGDLLYERARPRGARFELVLPQTNS